MVVKKETVNEQEVVTGGTSFKTIIALGVLALGLCGGSFLANRHFDAKIKEAQDINGQIQVQIKDTHYKNDQIIRKTAYTDVEGLTAERMDADRGVIEEFFKPVFQYKSGKEYDANRENMLKLLGKGNSVLEYYMPENEKIENSTQVDMEGKFRQLKNVTIYPVKKELKGFSYIALIDFVYYKEASDLAHLDKLAASHAVIRCYVTEDKSNTKQYTVTDVTGYGSY